MAAELKTAFITGAGSGIGRALAHTMAARGATVFITDINEENLEAVHRGLQKKGADVHAFSLDVADKNAVFKMAEKAKTLMGNVDIVFNNAGVSLSDTVEKMEYQDFEWLMDINFWGVVHGTKAFLPHMLERKFGHIVNISSLFGLIGIPSQAAYCAAKHAVKGFNESLYLELQGTGVYVHSVHPGGVNTGIVVHGIHKNKVNGKADVEEVQKNFEKLALASPAQAADSILAGIDKGKYRIIVGKDARRADLISRWMPNKWLKMLAKRTLENDGSAF